MVHNLNLRKMSSFVYIMITVILLTITTYGVFETTQRFRVNYVDFRNQYTMNATVREWIVLVEMSEALRSIVSKSVESKIDIVYYEKKFDSIISRVENLQSNISKQDRDVTSTAVFSELQVLHTAWKQTVVSQPPYQNIKPPEHTTQEIEDLARPHKLASQKYISGLRKYESQIEYQHIFKTRQAMAEMHLALISIGLIGLMVLMLAASYINPT